MIIERNFLDDMPSFYDIGRSVNARWTAPSRREVFARAVPALFGCFVEIEKVMPKESRQVHISARDPKTILENWLRELVLVYQTERTLFRSAETSVTDRPDGGLDLRGHLWGEPVDASRHSLENHIGILTEANIENVDGLYRASLALEVRPGRPSF